MAVTPALEFGRRGDPIENLPFAKFLCVLVKKCPVVFFVFFPSGRGVC
jgi:hypothetical protein